jgi:hypothetical protein
MKTSLSLLFIFSCNLSFSQVEFFPDFSLPSASETAITKCNFDPEAEAMYLRKDAIILPDEDRRMISHHRVRIKILNDNATSFGEIKIPFYHQDNYEVIEDIKAIVINYNTSGEKITSTLSAKDIYTRKKDAYYAEVSFALPDVRKYSILEYTYTSKRRSYRPIDYWYFQDELPVLHSHFEFTILPNSEFSYRVLRSPVYPVNLVHDKNLGKLIFDMNDLPAIPQEPYMDSRNDYLQRVELQLASVGSGIDKFRFVSSWPEATSQLLRDEDFGIALDRNIPGTGDIINTAKTISDEKKRMEFLFRQVINNISWNGYQGIYMAGKLKSIWTDKKGSVAEMNLLLINLMRSAGLEADPLLVSERWHGKVTTEQAFLTQFNKVIACVTISEKNYFLDATDPQQVLELIPRDLLNTTAYLVNKKHSRFLKLTDQDHMDRRTINFIGKIHPDANMQGQALLIDKDYARVFAEESLKEDKGAYVRNNYIEPYHAMEIDSFHLENEAFDSLPLNQDIRFSCTLQQSGDYLMIPMHLFSGMGKNPFVAGQRYTHINFGCRKSITFNESFSVDKSFAIDAMPKNISFIMPDTSIVFKRMLEYNETDNRITARITLDFYKAVYTADEYPMVFSFYKKLYALLEEPILLKKR